MAKPAEQTGRTGRVVIEGVRPEIDAARFPIKRTLGETVEVEADIFTDGYDELAAVLRFRREDERAWSETPMAPLGNDRWRGSFAVAELGRYRYTIAAWVDGFATWRRDLSKRLEADQDVSVDLLIGADLVARIARRATGDDAGTLRAWARQLRAVGRSGGGLDDPAEALDDGLAALMAANADRRHATVYEREPAVVVDPERARFSTWYELFPRSASPRPGRHGTLADVEARLPHVAEMGFDVLYLPPIHPIGRTHRKGRNNVTAAVRGDPGSPWAIGSEEGGHTAIHPQLGTLDDFDRLVRTARGHGVDVAIDLAFQCSPDHPWVREHPEWFRRRPDGSIQYAENPPKKYQDIYPLDFETQDRAGLWSALEEVVRFWIGHGVRIFRVDNPHTKPFAFWEWLIGGVKRDHPEVLFLAEAFTRPRVMYRLAKLGFSQSYTYFTWRNTKSEITDYFTELTRTDVVEYFRPNLWPNTPDILHAYLQTGGRAGFAARLVLAATLGASYGIYGPAFERCVSEPLHAGSEEYGDSEKYRVRCWEAERNDAGDLSDLVARLNAIRRANAALQRDRTLAFHATDNDQVIAYSKTDPEGGGAILTVVNLDPHHVQSGWLTLSLGDLGLARGVAGDYEVRDLLSDAGYRWHGERNFVQLDPASVPAHVFRVRPRDRAGRDPGALR